jgi:hypothetical protein
MVGLPADLIDDLSPARYEAKANAVEHACPGSRLKSCPCWSARHRPGWMWSTRTKRDGAFPDAGAGFHSRGLLVIKHLAPASR